MASSKKPKATGEKSVTSEESKNSLDLLLERLDKHAESGLIMARLFIDRGMIEIARRRLHEIVEIYGKSDAAREAKTLLASLSASADT
jgi:hypothetical protein